MKRVQEMTEEGAGLLQRGEGEPLFLESESEDSAEARMETAVSCIITASILHFKEHTTYCLRLSTATGT